MSRRIHWCLKAPQPVERLLPRVMFYGYMATCCGLKNVYQLLGRVPSCSLELRAVVKFRRKDEDIARESWLETDLSVKV